MTSKSSGVIKNSFAISDFVALYLFIITIPRFIERDGISHCVEKFKEKKRHA